MSSAQIAKYKAAFDKFDLNGDGRVNKEEIRASLVEMGVRPNEAMVEQIVRDGDKNGDGWIEWAEMEASLKRLPKDEHALAQKRGELKAIFIHMDKDQSGTLTPAEIKKGLEGKNVMPADELERRIKAADVDGDGNINYKEFLIMF